ncbi:hypothetical protein JTB14_033553 [Gonioctena quinquepunctata]|nr:hypothetical protein JTB14_033553 [Gonioctena quinquepunctata]
MNQNTKFDNRTVPTDPKRILSNLCHHACQNHSEIGTKTNLMFRSTTKISVAEQQDNWPPPTGNQPFEASRTLPKRTDRLSLGETRQFSC